MKRDGGAGGAAARARIMLDESSPAPRQVKRMCLVERTKHIEEGGVPDHQPSQPGQAGRPSQAGVEDERAIHAFQGGDQAAFEVLVTKYQERVYRICYRFTGNHYDADEVAQDVFVRVFKGLPRFRFESLFSTWLHRVAVNCCLNWVGAQKTKPVELGEELPDPSPGVLESLSREQLSATVRRAVQELPEKQRLTLILRVYHDLSHRDISAMIGCPVGTSKANFYFALRNLRKLLIAKGEVNDEGK